MKILVLLLFVATITIRGVTFVNVEGAVAPVTIAGRSGSGEEEGETEAEGGAVRTVNDDNAKINNNKNKNANSNDLSCIMEEDVSDDGSSYMVCSFRIRVDDVDDDDDDVSSKQNTNSDLNKKDDTSPKPIFHEFGTCFESALSASTSTSSSSSTTSDATFEHCVVAEITSSHSKLRKEENNKKKETIVNVSESSVGSTSSSSLSSLSLEEKDVVNGVSTDDDDDDNDDYTSNTRRSEEEKAAAAAAGSPPPMASSNVIVGKARYSSPYQSNYGITVGTVLEEYDTILAELSTSEPSESLEMIGWYVLLGNAHFDDAADTTTSTKDDGDDNDNDYSSKKYDIELAINAYTIALRALEVRNEDVDTTTPGGGGDGTANNNNGELILILQYNAVLQYSLGEAYTEMMNTSGPSSMDLQEEKVYLEKSITYYRTSKFLYEKLRYLYSAATISDESISNTDDATDDDDYDYDYDSNVVDDDGIDDNVVQFDEIIYYDIEKGYADSCDKLGMGLYSHMLFHQNEQVTNMNEKTMNMMKLSFGLDPDASDDEMMAALMNQAIIGGGGGAAAGNADGGANAFTFTVNAGDIDAEGLFGDDDFEFDEDNIFGGAFTIGGAAGNGFSGMGSGTSGGDAGGFGFDGKPSKKTQRLLNEIATYLDTAILTYQQHANYPPSSSTSSSSIGGGGIPNLMNSRRKKKNEKNSFTVIINGVKRKSKEEIYEENRIFEWRCSLAMIYGHASLIATTQQKHIRARELMNLALDLFLQSIMPIFKNTNDDGAKKKQQQNQKRKEVGPAYIALLSLSKPAYANRVMTYEYAKVSVATLYQSLSDTAFQLGHYNDSKMLYEKAMEWFTEYKLDPNPKLMYDFSLSSSWSPGSIVDDDATSQQYKELLLSFEKQLTDYKQGVKVGTIYKDDSYEAELLLSIGPMHLSLEQIADAIRTYKDAVKIYKRIQPTTDLDNKKNRRILLNLADAQSSLSAAFFLNHHYDKSFKTFKEMIDVYIMIYGEGNSPTNKESDQLGDIFEGMKDQLTASLGENVYEKIVQATAEGNNDGFPSKKSGATSITNFNFGALRNDTNTPTADVKNTPTADVSNDKNKYVDDYDYDYDYGYIGADTTKNNDEL